MKVSIVNSLVSHSLKKEKCKYLGNIRGGKQVWATDEEIEPIYIIDAILEDLAFNLGATVKIFDQSYRGYEVGLVKVEDAAGGKWQGVLPVTVDDTSDRMVFIEIVFGSLGDKRVTGGSCFFITFAEVNAKEFRE